MAITKLKSSEVEEQVAAARIIRKVLSVEQDPPIDLVLSAGAVPLLAALLDHTTPELVFEVVWALTNIASGTQAHVDHITAEEGAVDKLCTSLLEHANSDVREQAVWCIGNIASTNIALRDYILGIGTLGRVLAMITNTSQVSAMRNSTWTLSNLVGFHGALLYALHVFFFFFFFFFWIRGSLRVRFCQRRLCLDLFRASLPPFCVRRCVASRSPTGEWCPKRFPR